MSSLVVVEKKKVRTQDLKRQGRLLRGEEFTKKEIDLTCLSQST